MSERTIWFADTLPIPDEWTFFGVPLAVFLPILTVVGGLAGAAVTQLVKKFRTPADDREDKVLVLDASDKLIERFQNLLTASDERHAKEIGELSTKVDSLEKEVSNVRAERLWLISALIEFAQIARKFGGDQAVKELREVSLPEGVRVVPEKAADPA